MSGFGQALRAEWTKLRTVRGWVLGLVSAALVIVLMGLFAAAASSFSCSGPDGKPCAGATPPLGPAGYAKTIFYAPEGMSGVGKYLMLAIMTPVEALGKLAKPFALAIRLFANMVAGHIAMAFGARGPNYCTVSACASSAHAVGDAFRIVQRGDAADDDVHADQVAADITSMARRLAPRFVLIAGDVRARQIDAAYVARMEDVLELYAGPYDPARPVLT